MGSGCIVQVWFDREAEVAGAPARFCIIETELPDFATFCQLVEGDRLIGGAILWTRKVSRDEQLTLGRQPCAFRGSAVMRCQLPRFRYFEDAGEDAA